MNLLSFGEIIWDVYEDQCTIGGAPFNLAAHAALLGENAWLASAIGNDTLGQKALEHVEAFRVKTDYICVSEGQATGQCLVSLDKNRVPSYRIAEPSAYDCVSLPTILPQAFDVIAFGTLALRGDSNINLLDAILQNNHFEQIYTDLNIRAPFYSQKSIDFCLAHATIVKISDEELPVVTQKIFGEALELMEAVAAFARRYPQIRLLLITKGGKGSFCYDCRMHQVYNCQAEPATVVSTVGAGDSFGAAFLSWYMKTKDIVFAMKQASRVSAFVVSHHEAIPPYTEDFMKNMLPQ